MSWIDWHTQSENHAAEAHLALRRGELALAEESFRKAASCEASALEEIEPSKTRTLGITAVSAVALWFKGKEYQSAERIALRWLAAEHLPRFAQDELRELLQAIWVRRSMDEAGVSFLPGQVLVSIQGGQTISGGAPLDLVVERVQTVQSLFFRTIELMKGMHHRTRGAPPPEIQEACRPWLFQAVPGSYQFSVAVQEQRQTDLWKESPSPPRIAERFLAILRASAQGRDALRELVPQESYQATFMKLSRNLAPNGTSLARIEVRSADDIRGDRVVLDAEIRRGLTKALRPPRVADQESRQLELIGVLRAVHLDRDWLELLLTDGTTVVVHQLPSAVDDTIGPMVNRRVRVTTQQVGQRHTFVDLESDG